MRMGTISSLLMMALVVVDAPARAGDAPATPAARQFEALKGLAGNWVELGKDGKPTDTVISSIRVTAGGSVVEETIFPGTEKEMVTMYHLDGSDLVLTHYCMLGNQPRMKAEPAKSSDTIDFKFVVGTNLKSDADHHIGAATFKIQGKDHFQSEWTSYKDGKTCHCVALDLVRKG
jgi:hypothetical protein